jgi:RND superfamily putative drug exporter
VPLRIPLILLWIALALVLGLTAPSISDVSSSDQTSFLPTASNSIAARTIEAEKFADSGSASSGLLILARDGGLTTADRAFAEAIHNWLLSPEGPAIVQDVVSIFSHPEQTNTLISPDGAAMLLRVNLTVAAFQPAADEMTLAVRDRVQQGKPDGLDVHFTGEAGLGTDLVANLVESTDRTTIVTVILVIALLFIIYRSPLAILIPLITITLAYLVSRGVLGYLAQAGWQVSSLLDSYMVVLVFGAGTDYSLFFISRFREELAENSAYEAAVRSVQRIGAVIFASAITTIVGLSALGFARFGIVQSMGPGLAIAVAITLLAGLTLTPALLSLFGRHLFWPRKTSVNNTQPSAFWVNVGSLVAIRPLIPVVIISVLLAIPYLGLLQYRENFGVIDSLPKSTDTRQGFDTIADHFPRGEFAPAVVLLEFADDIDLTSPGTLHALAEVQDQVLELDAVNQTRSVFDPVGDGSANVFSVPMQLGQIANAISAPAQNGDAAPVQLLNETSTQVRFLQQYVDELATAFPEVAQSTQFIQARQALVGLSDTTTIVREQAHPAAQLRQLAAQITQPDPRQDSAGSGQGLATAGLYLAELSEAFPAVATQPAYQEARALLAEIQQLAQSASATDSASAQQSQIATALAAVAAHLNQLGTYFDDQPNALFFPSDASNQATEENSVEIAVQNLAQALAALKENFAAHPYPYFNPTSLPDMEKATEAIFPVFFSEDGSTVRFFVILKKDPLGLEAIDTLKDIRQALWQDRTGPLASARVFVGGATAEFADMQQIVRQDLQTVGIVTVVGIFSVLALLLRSLVAPIYLVATVVFSYGSSLGLATLFFQRVLGHEGVYYLLPLLMMVMLIALGADYNVFLVHRIREESAKLPLREGVRVASARTGAIITAAGVILAGTFAALTASPLQLLLQMGAAIALGIIIDALVVRSLLVPGIVTLVGSANWWPATIKANWWPLLPAGTRTPLGNGEGLARGVVFLSVAAIIAVTYFTRGIWSPDPASAAGQAAVAAADDIPAVKATSMPAPSPTPLPVAQPTSVPEIQESATATPTTPVLPTPEPTVAPKASPGPSFYVVQSGDTLGAIAEEFGVSLAALAELNQIDDPNVIFVGQRLLIPAADQ